MGIQDKGDSRLERKGKEDRRNTSAKKIAYASILTSLSMIFSYVESLFPISIGIPGMKIGLANLVLLTGLYFLKPGEVFCISMARILITAFLFGNMSSLIYSLAGGIFSFLIMRLCILMRKFTMTGVSIAGAAVHNIAQCVVAALVVQESKILFYLPVLLLCGAMSGLLIGLIGKRCLPFLSVPFSQNGKSKDKSLSE